MRTPFTTDQFFDIFRRYNEAVWPTQWLLLIAALVALGIALRPRAGVDRVPAMVLAGLWLWMGAIYHLTFFRRINPAAVLFGTAFVAQAALFAWFGVRRGLRFAAPRGWSGMAGGALMLFALGVYPLLGYAAGHRYPATPTFGLPCPTTIFTLGLLLWAWPAPPRLLLVIPSLWAIVGTAAALQLGVPQDFGLAAALAVILATLALRRRGHDVIAAA